MTEEPEELPGGIANAGSVVRIGDEVRRPSNRHTESIHAFLHALRSAGFESAPVPLGTDGESRERLGFIAGDVPVPPYPHWAQTDDALGSIASLLARFHDAARTFDPTGRTWSNEMADPSGGTVVCHNDVCLENVVFVDGEAVGLLDFDFCAPGQTVSDVAAFARVCVPVDDDLSAARFGWHAADRPERLRLVADTYGLDARERILLLGALERSIARGGEFVRRRVEAGEAGFVKMWKEIGGMERFDRRRRWWAAARQAFEHALD